MASEQSYRCPSCGYEYQPWVKVCPDCGERIEEGPGTSLPKGKLAPDEDPKWTIVTNVPNAIIGTFIKSQLEDARIPVLMFRSPSADIAEFSHNDFVPQDLLVPRDRVAEARSLIDSAPVDVYGPKLHPMVDWDEEDTEDEIEPEESASEVAESQVASSTLPEGWQMLPSEGDIEARQAVRRSHGAVLKGWYWSDGTPVSARARLDGGKADGAFGERNDDYGDYEDFEDYSPPDRFSAYRPRSSYDDNQWPSRSKWTRIVYGVLLLVMSLPFLIQVLQHLFDIMRFGR